MWYKRFGILISLVHPIHPHLPPHPSITIIIVEKPCRRTLPLPPILLAEDIVFVLIIIPARHLL